MRVQEICLEQRPREKALQQGIRSLSDAELLALILGSGTRTCPVMDLAADVLKATSSLTDWDSFTPASFMKIPGIREAKALHLVASVDLARRIRRAKAFRSRPFDFNEVLEWCQLEFGMSPLEQFAAVFLDARGRILSSRVLSVGTQTESLVSIKGAFRAALQEDAAQVMFIHNHPSGDVTPSLDDIETTRALEEAGTTMGIHVVDHLIVGGSSWLSMKHAGYMKGE